MNYVIIGNSYSAIGAVEGIRAFDQNGAITIVSEENYLAYARPLISYALGGQVPVSKMNYRNADFYEKNRVSLLLDKKAVSLDDKRRRIVLNDKQRLNYDKLLISTGGEPFKPEIKGIEARNVFSFNKLDDAIQIRKTARKMRKAVVYGGGLIGLKAAEGLNNLGLDVTIVARRRMLAGVLDEISGEILEDQLRKNGITLKTGHTVKEVHNDQKGNVCSIVLDDDNEVECEVLVLAVGIRPRTELVKNTGVRINKGIMVDRFMMTSVRDIYAAGDVAEAHDVLNGRDSVIAIVPLALEQGRVAGSNMAGCRTIYSGGLGMNSINVHHLPVMTMGIANPAQDTREVWTFRRGKIYRKLVFEENRLIGAVLVSAVDYGGILTRLIRSRTDIDDIKLELTRDVLKKGDFASVLSKLTHGHFIFHEN